MLPLITRPTRSKQPLTTLQRQGHITRQSESRSLLSARSISYQKPKKLCYSDKARRREIRHENKRLLKSITSIVKKSVVPAVSERKRSMNGAVRKKELIRITKENHAFLRRLERIKSFNSSRRPESKIAEKSLRIREEYASVVNLNKTNTIPRVRILKSMPCLLYTSPSPRDSCASRMPSSACKKKKKKKKKR
eukprot:TRINITY_DN8715_c0_g1_i3.p1 TRINITY_DN8715_c0_g1~~TRINITY_DN8715_c0_g1_i3.p1  ORF type:complete len:193 (-),score=46.96 TRINITY_DN8715_c0_g1_i3:48-626(-)